MQIEYKKLKGGKHSSVFEVTAQRNTWSHQRRKQREQKRDDIQHVLEGSNSRETVVSPKEEVHIVSTETGSTSKDSRFVTQDSPTSAVHPQPQIDMKSMKRKHDEDSVCENKNKRSKGGEEQNVQETDDLLNCVGQTHESSYPIKGSSQLTNQSELYSHPLKPLSTKESQNPEINESKSDSFEENKDDTRNAETVDDFVGKNEECDLSSPHSLQKRCHTETNSDSCILKAVVSVSKTGSDIYIEMAWLDGTCGRDAMHQVMQYIKNNLKI